MRDKIREDIARKLWYFATGAILSRDDWRGPENQCKKCKKEFLSKADQILSILAESQKLVSEERIIAGRQEIIAWIENHLSHFEIWDKEGWQEQKRKWGIAERK